MLADLVDGISARSDMRVAALKTSHRFGESIGALASAIRDGDADRALEVLRAGGEHIEWIETDDPSAALRKVLAAACACGCVRRRMLGDATTCAGDAR